MKKTIITLVLLATGSALASPLSPFPYIYSPAARGPVPNPAYRQTSTPGEQETSHTPAQQMDSTPAPLRYSLGITGGYAFKAVPNDRYACDMSTAEIEGAYFLRPRHAVTLSLGYAGGGSTRDYWLRDDRGYTPFTDSYDRSSFTLMGGYRYSRSFGRYFLLQVGAKAGMDVQTLDVDYGPGWHPYPYGHFRGQDGTAVGFAYAGYANVGFFITETACLHIGYQFRGSTAAPTADSEIPDIPNFRTHSMRHHEVRLGLTIHF